MEQILNWRKGLFDSNYQVFSDGLLRFSINFASLKNAAVVTTQKGIYLLKSEGFSNPETRLVNNKNEVIAKITYSWINFKALVVLNTGEQFDWSFQNSWISRWSLNNHSDKQILFNSSTGNGLIHTNIDDEILIMIGLFIREYYSRVIFVFALIILLPIFFRGAF